MKVNITIQQQKRGKQLTEGAVSDVTRYTQQNQTLSALPTIEHRYIRARRREMNKPTWISPPIRIIAGLMEAGGGVDAMEEMPDA